MANAFKFSYTAQQISDLLDKISSGEGGVSVTTETLPTTGIENHLYIQNINGTISLYYWNGADYVSIATGGGGEPAAYIKDAELSDDRKTLILTKKDGITTVSISIEGLATSEELENKQDIIEDLDDIRAGAEAGSTAVQPSAISDMATKEWVEEQGYLTEHQSLEGLATEQYVDEAIEGKQDTLVSGQNIKTINGQSILGSGNIEVGGGGGSDIPIISAPETPDANRNILNFNDFTLVTNNYYFSLNISSDTASFLTAIKGSIINAGKNYCKITNFKLTEFDDSVSITCPVCYCYYEANKGFSLNFKNTEGQDINFKEITIENNIYYIINYVGYIV